MKLTRSLWSGWTFLTMFYHSPLCLLWFLHSAVHIDKIPFASKCLPVFAVPSTWNFYLWMPAWLSWPPHLGTKSININATDTPSFISSDTPPPSPEPHHHHSLPFILPCYPLSCLVLLFWIYHISLWVLLSMQPKAYFMRIGNFFCFLLCLNA